MFKNRISFSFQFAPGSNSEGPSSNSFPLFVWIAMETALVISPTTTLAGECIRISALESYDATGAAPDGSICETFVGMANSRGVSCHWEFPFRSAEALSVFNDLWAEVTRCKEGSQTPLNAPVNHPDSYLLRELVAAVGTYRVARKDQGHAKRTLVFLSAEYGS